MNKNFTTFRRPSPVDDIFQSVDRIIHRMAQPHWVPRQELIADYVEAMALLAKAKRITDDPRTVKAVQWRRDMLNDIVFPKGEDIANEQFN